MGANRESACTAMSDADLAATGVAPCIMANTYRFAACLVEAVEKQVE